MDIDRKDIVSVLFRSGSILFSWFYVPSNNAVILPLGVGEGLDGSEGVNYRYGWIPM